MTYLAFIMTVVMWLPTGDLDTYRVVPFTSEADCLTAGAQLEADARAASEASAPAFRGSFHWDCRRVFNDSEKLHS